MGSREEVFRVATELFRQEPDWVTFFREVLGLDGIIRQAYSSPEELAEYEASEEYNQIQQMLAKLREQRGRASVEPTRVITVRMPKSLHEALRAESHARHTSMNELCISKLLQVVDDTLVPTESSEATSQPISLFFDLKDFGADDIAQVISALSELYRDLGGDGLRIDGMQMLDGSLAPVAGV